MSDAVARSDTPPPQPSRPVALQPCFAALDLGTNNCRLLIATARDGVAQSFRVVESFSRIVRLGEGLSRSGRLDEAAIERALAALRICAEKVRRRRVERFHAVATQACRAAHNGSEFVARVAQETGIALRIITPHEEAGLAVAGCRDLIDPQAHAALVVDVGGGSTELSWVDSIAARKGQTAPIRSWLSIPIGVVSLAERFPEPATPTRAWFEAMVDHVTSELVAFPEAQALRAVFLAGHGQLVGTSGAITSLAGMHLRLQRYDRARVDGLWMRAQDCSAAAERLLALDRHARAKEPCIGPDRADLVLAGAAILQAVQTLWPSQSLRVADRGLREGLLLRMIEGRRRGSGRARAGRRGGDRTSAA